ncbi:MAG: B12-binding domain-containing radical SAM protein [Sedimentisphaerales bacterium]|nr:B12-binding domain-containing radical SAM protein [Sedimentisphaerales bacterium]
MRVLLVPPKDNYPDPRPWMDMIGQGLPYIAGMLKSVGHEVYGINLNYRWCSDSAYLTLESSLKEAISKYNPHLIGLTGLSGDYHFVKDAITSIHEIAPNTPVVLGGGIITHDREYIFNDLKPDFAIVGDGEETIVKLVEYLEKGGDLASIVNLSYWKDRKPVFNKIQYSMADLDLLPLPDYEPFELELFFKNLNQLDGLLYAHTRQRPRLFPISIGRSCRFKCTFCCHTKGPPYRSRSISNAIKEVEYFYNKYQFNILFIYDELFAYKKERILELCSSIKRLRKMGMDFDWACFLAVSNVDRDILLEMKECGCTFVGYGLESASEKVLKSMKKIITPAEILKAIKMSVEAGLGFQGLFIFGDPVETEESMRETMDFFFKWCRDLMVDCGYILPYPGSEIFEFCLENGIIKNKKDYYETVGRFTRKHFNMTKIPDKRFHRLVESMVHFNVFLRTDVLDVKWHEATSSDTDAPFEHRRPFFMLKVACPHCEETMEYLCPIKRTPGVVPDPLVEYCQICHRRFWMVFSEPLPEEPKLSSDKIKDLVDKPFQNKLNAVESSNTLARDEL